MYIKIVVSEEYKDDPATLTWAKSAEEILNSQITEDEMKMAIEDFVTHGTTRIHLEGAKSSSHTGDNKTIM
jgi:hypothetical protein|tara:strand:- start:335 stop:547 length:213 start_codon:yes stop_codon:yes gene_type:complete